MPALLNQVGNQHVCGASKPGSISHSAFPQHCASRARSRHSGRPETASEQTSSKCCQTMLCNARYAGCSQYVPCLPRNLPHCPLLPFRSRPQLRLRNHCQSAAYTDASAPAAQPGSLTSWCDRLSRVARRTLRLDRCRPTVIHVSRLS